ncbi:hypothetical protein [Streptomyces sp. NPDC058665]|uniref:hypothetical protein n=1 Tax=Streptomyces sp. NPDC058665 TaxID=3346586 RepID=UPI00365FA9CC
MQTPRDQVGVQFAKSGKQLSARGIVLAQDLWCLLRAVEQVTERDLEERAFLLDDDHGFEAFSELPNRLGLQRVGHPGGRCTVTASVRMT